MAKDPEERYRQADYYLETAEYMFAGGRYFFSKLQFTLKKNRKETFSEDAA